MTSPKVPVLNSRVSLYQAATRPGDQTKTLVTVHVSVTIPLHCPFPPLFLGHLEATHTQNKATGSSLIGIAFITSQQIVL